MGPLLPQYPKRTIGISLTGNAIVMFSTCIHCTASLGRNEAIEAFPVGKRLAFDQQRGRLWVVCPACARWNLSPLEERWEAIEAMERAFRDTRLRVSTDQVGLARLRAGVDLIRIGNPLRPEMAAWRYGDQFGRRRKQQLLATGAVVGSAAVIVGGMFAAGVSVGSFLNAWTVPRVWEALIQGRQGKSIGLVQLPDGTRVELQRRHARMSALEKTPDGALQLRLESKEGTHLLQGADAFRAAQRLMPVVNRFGGTPEQVQQAVRLLDERGAPDEVWRFIQQAHGWRPGQSRWKPRDRGWQETGKIAEHPGTLHQLTPTRRLALEMALHEEQERLALEGELAALEEAWRDAEEIAAIADTLVTPSIVEERLAALRGRPREG